MDRRSYNQYCGLARALDLVGERWTPLIVRELALSPRRFTHLLSALPGLGTSLLSQRLRDLEAAGIAERVAADRASGGGVVYRLTPSGAALARALVPLTAWGATQLVSPPDAEFDSAWLAFVIREMFAARGVSDARDDCYEFRVDGAALWVTVADGRTEVAPTEPRSPDLTVSTTLRVLASVALGLLDPGTAVAEGALVLSGDAAAGRRALEALGSTSRAPTAS